MNLFRSEEHVRRWPLYYRAGDDYVMSVRDWATVFSSSMFRNRLESEFLAGGPDYLEDYRRALRAMGKTIPEPDRVLCTVLFTDIVDSTNRAQASATPPGGLYWNATTSSCGTSWRTSTAARSNTQATGS